MEDIVQCVYSSTKLGSYLFNTESTYINTHYSNHRRDVEVEAARHQKAHPLTLTPTLTKIYCRRKKSMLGSGLLAAAERNPSDELGQNS